MAGKSSEGKQNSKKKPGSTASSKNSSKQTSRRGSPSRKKSPAQGARRKSTAEKSTSSGRRDSSRDRKRRFWIQQILIGLTLILLLLTLVAVSIVFFPVHELPEYRDHQVAPAPEEKIPERDTKTEDVIETPIQPDFPPIPSEAETEVNWLVFVIDDAGYSLDQLQVFLDSPAPMTIAVLPHLPYSADAAVRSHASGKEVIVHMPMEALNGDLDPGPGAIYVSDSAEEIREKTVAAFTSVPYSSGANNHMGSAVTRNSNAMEIFLRAMKDLNEDFIFLDSRTTSDSVGIKMADQSGVRSVERDIFLDNEDTRSAIIAAIEEGKSVSRKQGHAVMIGHVFSEHLGDIITEFYPELMQEGYRLTTLTELISYLSEPNR
ncbi:divergent polysaccharide deacetylase family protein [Spirochaeta dissipatitropha]